jgi:hypothetical protein
LAESSALRTKHATPRPKSKADDFVLGRTPLKQITNRSDEKLICEPFPVVALANASLPPANGYDPPGIEGSCASLGGFVFFCELGA